MTHMRPMRDDEGEFSAPETTTLSCRKCKGGPVTVQTWTSSCGGYEDYKYTCAACGHCWWVDGIDS